MENKSNLELLGLEFALIGLGLSMFNTQSNIAQSGEQEKMQKKLDRILEIMSSKEVTMFNIKERKEKLQDTLNILMEKMTRSDSLKNALDEHYIEKTLKWLKVAEHLSKLIEILDKLEHVSISYRPNDVKPPIGDSNSSSNLMGSAYDTTHKMM